MGQKQQLVYHELTESDRAILAEAIELSGLAVSEEFKKAVTDKDEIRQFTTQFVCPGCLSVVNFQVSIKASTELQALIALEGCRLKCHMCREDYVIYNGRLTFPRRGK